VKTPYGQIQGFKVNLYDNPHPEYSVRPEYNPVEKVQGNVSVFLGIPYAMPPVNEGRFKVSEIWVSSVELQVCFLSLKNYVKVKKKINK
jgi:Carboxylesterase type B